MGCLANRTRAGWGSWLEVIERVPFFAAEETFPNSGFPSIWEPAFVRLLHEVDGQFDGSGKDYSQGGLYFCDSRFIERQWFRDNVLADRVKVADMNTLLIFK